MSKKNKINESIKQVEKEIETSEDRERRKNMLVTLRILQAVSLGMFALGLSMTTGVGLIIFLSAIICMIIFIIISHRFMAAAV